MRTRVLITAALVGASALAAPAAAAEEPEPAAPGPTAQQWGLDQVHAPDAWPVSTGAGQTIAVVDSGVDLDHPDLANKLVPGATFVGCGDRPAPCGNGDWRGTDGEGQPADVHGTHVAGIAAASGGVTGVAPDARIMPIKALEDGSGSFAEIGQGVRHAADNGADVINLSVGALPGSQALTLLGLTAETKEAIAYAREKGVVVVAAAGNETAPLCATPAFESGALCVGATDQQENRALYSNLGIKLDTDVVSGPGGSSLGGCEEDIWSTVPRGMGSGECGDADHDALAGTSMAAPHVSGVAALLTAQGRNADGVEQALLDSARTPLLGDARGVFNPLYGKGIVDAGAAVRAPA
ncbi:S8 family serine peptidase [Saccharopolyspora sp. HNM0983]|uniref:S8 family serine peptidase n=1 Tax=Saccharopolyspora montiporae TaxID=2781240 RepID=A0A929G070_9PSEU|nr:S8 family serine peptidase [Saccharopolyspora sp. HNM0983]MBE9375039.1 S8 family serine peptidase [Saccharopolyspora sp. HNM0983]